MAISLAKKKKQPFRQEDTGSDTVCRWCFRLRSNAAFWPQECSELEPLQETISRAGEAHVSFAQQLPSIVTVFGPTATFSTSSSPAVTTSSCCSTSTTTKFSHVASSNRQSKPRIPFHRCFNCPVTSLNLWSSLDTFSVPRHPTICPVTLSAVGH